MEEQVINVRRTKTKKQLLLLSSVDRVGLEPVALEHVRLVACQLAGLDGGLGVSELVDNVVEVGPLGLTRETSRLVEQVLDLAQLCEQVDDQPSVGNTLFTFTQSTYLYFLIVVLYVRTNNSLEQRRIDDGEVGLLGLDEEVVDGYAVEYLVRVAIGEQRLERRLVRRADDGGRDAGRIARLIGRILKYGRRGQQGLATLRLVHEQVVEQQELRSYQTVVVGITDKEV